MFKLSRELEGLRDVNVTSLEMLSLYAVRSLMAPLAGTPIYESLQTLFGKLHGQAQKIGNCKLDIFPHVYMEHTRVNDFLVLFASTTRSTAKVLTTFLSPSRPRQ